MDIITGRAIQIQCRRKLPVLLRSPFFVFFGCVSSFAASRRFVGSGGAIAGNVVAGGHLRVD